MTSWSRTRAGQCAGIGDGEYTAAGARIAATADEKQSELIVKVKEPLASERMKLRRGQIIFTYLHLAPDPEQTYDLMKSGVTAIAYETVTDAAGKLPLLAPMSKVAGRMAPQVAAHCLERPSGGRGILLSGIDDVPSAKIVVLGGGVVGQNAAVEIAIGMGAEVTVVARSAETRHSLSQLFRERICIAGASQATIEALCTSADVVIAAALVAGATAPKLLFSRTVAAMKPGAVIVDVSIDQAAAAPRPPGRRPTRNRPLRCIMWCTIASRICREPCRGPPHSRSTMRHVRSSLPWQTRVFRGHWKRMRIFATGLTSTMAR